MDDACETMVDTLDTHSDVCTNSLKALVPSQKMEYLCLFMGQHEDPAVEYQTAVHQAVFDCIDG